MDAIDHFLPSGLSIGFYEGSAALFPTSIPILEYDLWRFVQGRHWLVFLSLAKKLLDDHIPGLTVRVFDTDSHEEHFLILQLLHHTY